MQMPEGWPYGYASISHYDVSVALTLQNFLADDALASFAWRGSMRAEVNVLASTQCLIFQASELQVTDVHVTVAQGASAGVRQCICGRDSACLAPKCLEAVPPATPTVACMTQDRKCRHFRSQLLASAAAAPALSPAAAAQRSAVRLPPRPAASLSRCLAALLPKAE